MAGLKTLFDSDMGERTHKGDVPASSTEGLDAYEDIGAPPAVTKAPEMASTLDHPEMERVIATMVASNLDDGTHARMSHTPVIVAAASCQDIVLRWRSVQDADWPIERYVLQRFPNAHHERQWSTLVESNVSDLTDREVLLGKQYLYRLQAVNSNARSAFTYQSVTMNTSGCYVPTSLVDYLPSVLVTIPWIRSLSIEAVQTFVLICSCFLAVYSLVRANVRKVQHTQSRRCRLQRMHRTTIAESGVSKPWVLDRSSSESSTDPSTSVADGQSTRSSRFESSASLQGASDVSHAGSHISAAGTGKAACCPFCRKKFGLFRRRRVCDVCRAVTLCRKCNVQAPLDCDLEELRESLTSRHSMESLARPSISFGSNGGLRPRRVKTICRGCSAEAQRFSTMGAGRPSFPTLR